MKIFKKLNIREYSILKNDKIVINHNFGQILRFENVPPMQHIMISDFKKLMAHKSRALTRGPLKISRIFSPQPEVKSKTGNKIEDSEHYEL